MRSVRSSAGILVLLGLAWLALGTACRLTEGSAKHKDPYAYRGNYAIGIPGAEEGIRMDAVFQILWTTQAAGSSGRVSVFLHSDSGELLLAGDLPDRGGFLADLRGLRLPPANVFRVKVVDAGHPDRMDFSSSFSFSPSFQPRVFFRGPARGAVLQLDSSYTFRLELPPGPKQDHQLFLLRGDDVVAYLPSDLSGSDLTVRLTGTGVGSGAGFRFRFAANSWSVDSPAYFGLSDTFSISSEYFGGAAFIRPGLLDTLEGGTVDTLVYVKQGNPGQTEAVGLFVDTALFAPLIMAERRDSGDTTRIAWRVPEGLATDPRYRIGVGSASDPGLPVSFTERFTVQGIEPDGFEPDDGPESAREIRLGAPPQYRTLPDGDGDWVGFDGAAGRAYAIRIEGLRAYRYQVTQDTFQIPVYEVHSELPPSANLLIVRPKATGPCRVGIESPWPSQPPDGYDYSLALHEVDLDSSGFKLAFTAPGPGAAVPTGEVFSLRWIADSVLFNSVVRIDLYLDTVLVQTLSESAANSGSFAWSVHASLERSSSYRLRISRPDDRRIFGQSPSFSIAGIPRDAYEPDNIRSLAKRIEPGFPAQDRSLLVSDTDWVAFECRPGTTYRVAATSGFPLMLNVFAGLRHTTGGINPTLSDVRGVGECAVQVLPYQSNAGGYGLSVLQEPQ